MTIRARVRAGRVRGYAPSAKEFEKLISLAQKDFEPSKSNAEAACTVGEDLLRTDPELGIADVESLQALIESMGNLKELDNLVFCANQQEPRCHVRIEVGPGETGPPIP